MLNQKPWLRLPRSLLAILPVLLAFAAQHALWSLIQPYVWFLFYPALFASAWIGGLRGGVLATMLATALVWWFFVPPAYVLNKHAINPLFSALVFLGMGVALSLLQQRLQQANQRAADALAKVRLANAELQSANQKITQLYEHAKQLDELKTQFFSNVSHELRTPLALILGPAQQLLAGDTLGAEQSRQLQVILRNAQTLLGHVNDLLDMSKLEAGQMPLDYAVTDLAQLVDFVASHFEVQAQDQQMQLVIQHEAALSAQVDAQKLQRILFNLLSNAFKFTPAGGTVRISLQADAANALIEVADSGPGIPADKRQQVFERFRQLDGGANRRYGGTGLGLAIASDLIALHGGNIDITAAPEGGALFRITLPLMAPAGVSVASRANALEPISSVPPEILPAPAVTAALPQPSHGPLLLVVEDNPQMSQFICENLADVYRLATAYDGQQGLKLALQLKPDLILCDVMLPAMSGDQLVAAIRTHAELDRTPIVLLSARTDEQLRINLLRHGAQDYLTKPFSVDELRARVAGLVARKIAEDNLRESNQLLAYRAFLLANVSDAILATDKNYLITYWNPSAEVVYGWRADEALGRHSGELLQSESYNGIDREQAFGILMQQGRFDGELRQTRKDGSKIIVQGAAIALRNAAGEFDGYVAIARDVTRLKQDEARLRQAAAVFDATSEAILVTDEQGCIVAVNRAFEQITGYHANDVFGQNPHLLQSGRQPPAFYEKLWQQLASTGQWQGELWNQRQNGEDFPVWENISAVRDSNGKVTHYVAVMSDISALKDAEQRLQHLAHHDTLTGLPNRRLFNISLEQALERSKRRQQKLGLLFLDLDRFKQINDTLGHAVGDLLLREVSERLRHNVRAEDIVARLAGDEFIVIVENIGQREDLVPLASKLLNALAAPMNLADHEVPSSCSIGISIYPDDADNMADLIKAADAAMYRAKQRGRHTCEFYNADLPSPTQQTR